MKPFYSDDFKRKFMGEPYPTNEVRITTGWDRDDRWRKWALGDFDYERDVRPITKLQDEITNMVNKEKEKMFKKVNDIRVLFDGNLYAVDGVTCTEGPFEGAKYTIDFRPTSTNKRDRYIQPATKVDPLQIKRVIVNGPATIVFWADNTKTIVKCNNDNYDLEKGIAMAIAKKALGNKGNYYNVIRKAIKNADAED